MGDGVGRHAEIAGGGFGGLTAAIALLQRGWSVTLHERADAVRSEGYGIAIHENGIRVLDALGVADDVAGSGVRIVRHVSRDSNNAVSADLPISRRTYRISRQDTVEVLADRAASLGGEIVTSSEVASATAAGELVLSDGTRRAADLVVAADGINSPVRDSLGLLKSRRLLSDGAMRVVVPRTSDDGGDGSEAPVVEYWSGKRRIIVSPCSPTETYVALSCMADDAAGRAIPLDAASWAQSFPQLDALIERMATTVDWEQVHWQQFQVVRLRSWSAGRVAVVGDAAHAMPPNLGQGGGCAMMNALSLAVAVDGADDLPAALAEWERSERPLTDHTQRFAALYGRTTAWPDVARSAFFRGVGRFPSWRARMDRTASHVPTGTA